MNAADLPEGTKVGSPNRWMWKESGRTPNWPWKVFGENLRLSNNAVDDLLAAGVAKVLRVGDGTEETP